ncbi:putative surface protease GP63, putative,metallopeptidase [Trypanosoma theileri]|uniref:Leishmanolysin-like peptidase n=1 Tax=Trypanosoma theileri TaxID=67003 RepID=A0A1X0NGV9_9TRYP|nr:putative surface protease GP63, putative,metallopeptidase [Trypanosoma theileri]ORC83419.1 putative surface protease GP63, putative,metallopeptidase [Trypanosoma theileri]
MAETMRWGNHSGCGFLSGDCVEKSEGKHSDVSCDSSSVATRTTTLQCTSDRFALGHCTRSLSSQPISVFSAEHRGEKRECAVVKATAATVCENGSEAHMPGSRIGNTSRCLKGDALRLRDVSTIDIHSVIGDICANVKCEGGKVSVQYKGDDHWYECKEGSSISPSVTSVFSSGRIVCPPYSEVCMDLPIEPLPTEAVVMQEEVYNVTASI